MKYIYLLFILVSCTTTPVVEPDNDSTMFIPKTYTNKLNDTVYRIHVRGVDWNKFREICLWEGFTDREIYHMHEIFLNPNGSFKNYTDLFWITAICDSLNHRYDSISAVNKAKEFKVIE